MKPRSNIPTSSAKKADAATTATTTASRSSPAPTTAPRKTKNGTTAGRKIARKTAHSLIERRRRSKMNEEFGVLKDMVPACAGQEMHKLAILQVHLRPLLFSSHPPTS